jgi:glucosyltransferase
MQEVDFQFEVVIGTDCSADQTDNIVREYHSRFPHIVRPVFRSHNIGALANARSILKKARGKYIATCDGDDEWTDPRKLQKQVAILENTPDAVLVYTDIDQFYVNTRRRVPGIHRRLGRRSRYADKNAWFEAILLRKAVIHTATICVRTESMQAASADVDEILNNSPMGDTPILLALTQYGDFKYLPDSTALMNRLSESESRSQSFTKRAEFYLGSVKMQIEMARKYCYWSKRFERMLAGRALMLLRFSILARNSALATRIMKSLSDDVHMTWLHRLLHKLASRSWASSLYRQCDATAISIRRFWRRLRYGVESSA